MTAGNGGAGYQRFGHEYQHIGQNNPHGLSDGAYTRYHPSGFFREPRTIRARAEMAERNGLPQ
jgi:hypothetical protein